MMAAGALIYKQRPSNTQIVAVPIALTGLIMAVGFDWSASRPDFQIGVIFGFLYRNKLYRIFIIYASSSSTVFLHNADTRDCSNVITGFNFLGFSAILKVSHF